jgi:hypothetical protein
VRTKLVTIAALALLALSSCAKEDTNSDGNGPGDADGFGGRADPSNTPSARDAAPGRLSETSPPSASSEDRTQDEPPADAKDDQPHQ